MIYQLANPSNIYWNNAQRLVHNMELLPWLDGYSNCGTKIKTASIKQALADFQKKYPEKQYTLQRQQGLWYIVSEAKK